MKRSQVDFKPGKPGDNVAVPIPLLDHSRGEPQNILGMTVYRNVKTDIYKTAVHAGVLNGRCSRNQFGVYAQKLLTEHQDQN